MEASRRREFIESALRERLDASHVEVIDESARHVGHPGSAAGAGHFRVLVVSPRFAGLGRVAAHRLVYEVLRPALAEDIHALQLRTFTPEGWRAQGAGEE